MLYCYLSHENRMKKILNLKVMIIYQIPLWKVRRIHRKMVFKRGSLKIRT